MIAAEEISFHRTPLTLIVAGVAAALEIVCTLDDARRMQLYNDFRLGIFWQVWQGELWRPVTTTLLHGNLLHAGFNLAWWVPLASAVERRFGPARLALLTLLVAAGSTMAQYVYADYLEPDVQLQGGMVGMSGVVYGLFGFVWASRARSPDLARLARPETLRLLLGWAVFCWVATVGELMSIANMAHGVGLALGYTMGQALFARTYRGLWRAAALALLVATLGTLVGAPGHAGYEMSRLWRP